ncbi:MAG TPA: ribosomal subunit interface protein [Acidimicrobiia bacterium]|nr:ribosomal subunit interface protein [Acidimicrobiia bacterium]
MQVVVRTDRGVEGSAELTREVEAEVDSALSRFGVRLTRVEVHLGDENAGKHGADDKRCTVEARPSGMKPVAVTHHAATSVEALRGALRKLQSRFESTFGRLDDRKGRDSIRRGEKG